MAAHLRVQRDVAWAVLADTERRNRAGEPLGTGSGREPLQAFGRRLGAAGGGEGGADALGGLPVGRIVEHGCERISELRGGGPVEVTTLSGAGRGALCGHDRVVVLDRR